MLGVHILQAIERKHSHCKNVDATGIGKAAVLPPLNVFYALFIVLTMVAFMQGIFGLASGKGSHIGRIYGNLLRKWLLECAQHRSTPAIQPGVELTARNTCIPLRSL
jgi:hypothetical protein